MQQTYTNSADFGADIIGWALGELSPKDRNAVVRILSKSMPRRSPGRLGGSFKGAWWTRRPILKFLYSHILDKEKRPKDAYLGILFEPVRQSLQDTPEAQAIDAMYEEVDKLTKVSEDGGQAFLDYFQKKSCTRLQMAYLMLSHAAGRSLDVVLPFVEFVDDGKGGRALVWRKTPATFKDKPSGKTAALSLVMNAGKTIDKVVTAPEPEPPAEPEKPAAEASAAEPASSDEENMSEETESRTDYPSYVSEERACAAPPERKQFRAGDKKFNQMCFLLCEALQALPKEERDQIGRHFRRVMSREPRSVSVKGTWWTKPAVVSRLAMLSYPSLGSVRGGYLAQVFAPALAEGLTLPVSGALCARIYHGDRGALEELRKKMVSGMTTDVVARIILMFAVEMSLDRLLPILSVVRRNGTNMIAVNQESISPDEPEEKEESEKAGEEDDSQAASESQHSLPERTPFKADARLLGPMCELLLLALGALPKAERDAIGANLRRAVSRGQAPNSVAVKGAWWEKPSILAFLIESAYPSPNAQHPDFLPTLLKPVFEPDKLPNRFAKDLLVRVINGDKAALEEFRTELAGSHFNDVDLSRVILAFAASRALDVVTPLFVSRHEGDRCFIALRDPSDPGPESPSALDLARKTAETAAKEPVKAEPAESAEVKSAPAVVPKRFPGEYKAELPSEKPDATRWLGYVRSSQGGFFNFYPVAVWKNGVFETYPLHEATTRFPSRGGFNMLIGHRRAPCDGAFYVAETLPVDFIKNTDLTTGKIRDDYAVRVSFDELVHAGRFWPASDFGVCLIVHPASKGSVDFSKPVPIRYSLDSTEKSQLRPVGESISALLLVDDLLYGPVQLKEDRNYKPFVEFSAAARLNDGLITAFEVKADACRRVMQLAWEGKTPVSTALTCADMRAMTPVLADVYTDEQVFERVRAKCPDLGDLNVEAFRRAALQSFSEREDVSRARYLRFVNFVRRAQESFTDKLELASLMFETMTGDRAFLEAVVKLTAADNRLLKTYCQNSVISHEIDVTKKKLDEVRAAVQSAKAEAEAIRAESDEAREKLAALKAEADKQYELLGLIAATSDRVAELKGIEARHAKLADENRRLETLNRDVLARVNDAAKRAQRYGEAVLPEEMIQGVAAWNDRTDKLDIADRARAVSALAYDGPKGDALASHLVALIKKARPYDENTVLNLFICYVQNFLTVFAGEPGSGKTSICTLMADALGLIGIDRRIGAPIPGGRSLSRFVNVPVEYGWTTKRDFIGYRNPLTGRFESPDPARWGLIRQLDAEARSEAGSVYPAMMLLDEANLSPMEYYWADFMRLCDGHRNPGYVTLESSGPSAVPDTLRFVATINSDATTETLSPRLIDRAAVVTLPTPSTSDMRTLGLADVSGPLIPWTELKAVFGARPAARNVEAIGKILAGLGSKFAELGIRLSPRSRAQIENYVGTASSIFVETEHASHLDALDFAVMQKLLPRINGTGDVFRSGLESLRDELELLKLGRSTAVLESIITDGTEMDSYQFF